MKQRLKGAKMGHSLLKKKSDALQIKFRAVAKKIMDVSYSLEFSPLRRSREPCCVEITGLEES